LLNQTQFLGNPTKGSNFLISVKRIEECYGKLPRQVAADAGYASADNVSAAKALGIKAVGLPKKRGMKIEEMTGSDWIYKKLKRFRAGIEGNIPRTATSLFDGPVCRGIRVQVAPKFAHGASGTAGLSL
jgi:IS5 family transposase